MIEVSRHQRRPASERIRQTETVWGPVPVRFTSWATWSVSSGIDPQVVCGAVDFDWTNDDNASDRRRSLSASRASTQNALFTGRFTGGFPVFTCATGSGWLSCTWFR